MAARSKAAKTTPKRKAPAKAARPRKGNNPAGINQQEKTSPEAIALRQKEDRLLRLRLSGASLARIAEVEGYADESGACKAIKRAMARVTVESATELKKVELLRLDALLLGLWRVATGWTEKGTDGKPDVTHEPDMTAVKRCLEISRRRAELLGLDAPKRRILEVVDNDEFLRICGELEAEIATLEGDGQVEGEPVA